MSPQPGSRLKHLLKNRLHLEQDPNSSLNKLIQEIKDRTIAIPSWNVYRDKENNLQHLKDGKSKPGSYRRILKRKNKDFGCLFLETKARCEEQENVFRDKVEGKFKLLAIKRIRKEKPRLSNKYSQVCILCRTSLITVRESRKPWRRHSYIDSRLDELGVLITNRKISFSAHQNCLDYAHGKYSFHFLGKSIICTIMFSI